MYSTMDRQTLTECCLVFGVTCLFVAMCPATLDAINRVTSQTLSEYLSNISSTRQQQETADERPTTCVAIMCCALRR